MTDYEVLPTQKARLVDIKLAKHTCDKNRAMTTEGTACKKKKDQIIFTKLLIETLINTGKNKIDMFHNRRMIKVQENKVDVRELFTWVRNSLLECILNFAETITCLVIWHLLLCW